VNPFDKEPPRALALKCGRNSGRQGFKGTESPGNRKGWEKGNTSWKKDVFRVVIGGKC